MKKILLIIGMVSLLVFMVGCDVTPDELINEVSTINLDSCLAVKYVSGDELKKSFDNGEMYIGKRFLCDKSKCCFLFTQGNSINGICRLALCTEREEFMKAFGFNK